MAMQFDQIRDQQRETSDRFSDGWRKWDELVLGWLAPFGDALIDVTLIERDEVTVGDPLEALD